MNIHKMFLYVSFAKSMPSHSGLTIVSNKEVFRYTSRAPEMSLNGISFSGMQKIYLNCSAVCLRDYMTTRHPRCGDIIQFLTRCRSAIMDTQSANVQVYENSFGEVAMCSETPKTLWYDAKWLLNNDIFRQHSSPVWRIPKRQCSWKLSIRREFPFMDDEKVSIMHLILGNYFRGLIMLLMAKSTDAYKLQKTEMNLWNTPEYRIALIAHKIFNNLP